MRAFVTVVLKELPKRDGAVPLALFASQQLPGQLLCLLQGALTIPMAERPCTVRVALLTSLPYCNTVAPLPHRLVPVHYRPPFIEEDTTNLRTWVNCDVRRRSGIAFAGIPWRPGLWGTSQRRMRGAPDRPAFGIVPAFTIR